MIEAKKNFRFQENLVDSDKVVFVFTGMLTKIWHYRLFIRRLNKAGYSVVIYDYPGRIVHDAKLNEWQKLFEEVIKEAHERLKVLKSKGGKHFYAYGYSMGTVFAQKLVQESPDIHHIILNFPYGDVAANIWASPRTKRTRKSLRKQGVTLEELRIRVASFDPIVNANGLKAKKVLLHIAKRDRILNYPITRETKLAFEKAELDMQYIENKYLGHIAGGIKNMLAIKKIKNFYNS